MRVPKWSSPERGAERVNFDALLGAFCALYARSVVRAGLADAMPVLRVDGRAPSSLTAHPIVALSMRQIQGLEIVGPGGEPNA
jgi:hypothetical protein